MKEAKLAIINSRGRQDGLISTIVDGIQALNQEGLYKIHLKTSGQMPETEFVNYAREADLVLLAWGKDGTNIELAEKVGVWNRTFFIDGSEIGRNGRFDKQVTENIANGIYKGRGAIQFDLLTKCVGYFRREPPYMPGITPYPFGIESSYIKYEEGVEKDIDFVCIFGQEDYPPLRKEVRQEIEAFCRKNGFSYRTKQTKLPFFGIQSSLAKNRFRALLARAKVGVSVSGGGFDTFRFWEVLGNNCILLTDRIGIYHPQSGELTYKRIWQFSDLANLRSQLESLGQFLKEKYNLNNMSNEYTEILSRHSSKARVMSLLEEARKKGLLVEKYK